MAWAVWSLMLGMTWEYVSRVIAIGEAHPVLKELQ